MVELRSALFGAALILFGAGSSFACTCGDTPPSVAEARDNALAVFSGKVVDTEYRDGAVFLDGTRAGAELTVRFKIERWWKGDPIPEVFLFTEQYASDSSMIVSDCAARFEIGKRYLVYASFFFGRLRATYCSRTSEIGRASEDLKLLGKGPEA